MGGGGACGSFLRREVGYLHFNTFVARFCCGGEDLCLDSGLVLGWRAVFLHFCS